MNLRKKYIEEALEEFDHNAKQAPYRYLYTDWELEFIENIRSLHKKGYDLTQKQYNTLQSIARKHKL